MTKPKLTEKQETLLNELLEDFKGNTEAVMGLDGLMNQLRKRVVEAMLDGEMTSHLGYAPHAPAGNGSGNSRPQPIECPIPDSAFWYNHRNLP